MITAANRQRTYTRNASHFKLVSGFEDDIGRSDTSLELVASGDAPPEHEPNVDNRTTHGVSSPTKVATREERTQAATSVVNPRTMGKGGRGRGRPDKARAA
jgi:hypothetical protein